MAQIKKYELLNKKLKKLGISPTKNKKNFTTQDKRNISRLYNKYKTEADLAFKPRANERGNQQTFSTRKLKNKEEIKLAREMGYNVYKDQLFIKHGVNETVRMKRTKTAFSDGKKVLQIEMNSGVRRDIQIASQGDLLKYLENQGKKRVPKKNGKQQAITVKIGSDNPFSTTGSLAVTYEQLLNYISNWNPKDADKLSPEGAAQLKNKLVNLMSIVTVKSRR